MIFNEIKCHFNTSLGLVGGMHPPAVSAPEHQQRISLFFSSKVPCKIIFSSFKCLANVK